MAGVVPPRNGAHGTPRKRRLYPRVQRDSTMDKMRKMVVRKKQYLVRLEALVAGGIGG